MGFAEESTLINWACLVRAIMEQTRLLARQLAQNYLERRARVLFDR